MSTKEEINSVFAADSGMRLEIFTQVPSRHVFVGFSQHQHGEKLANMNLSGEPTIKRGKNGNL
jgi:hypothetical protein